MNYAIIFLAYVLCHGLTAFVVTPVQSAVLPEITVFASLIYLPHGVRVLATWAFGWKAIPALTIGAATSAWLFSPAEALGLLESAVLESVFVGAVSVFAAFELVRLFGYDFYAGHSRRLHWRGMIAIGALSSVINSIGQTLVFSGLIDLEKIFGVLAIYAFGDLIGLILCMVALMFIFRWRRILNISRS